MVTVPAYLALSDLRVKLRDKFGWTGKDPKLRIRDEDGELILLDDQDDLDACCESAITEAMTSRDQRTYARLTIWVKK